MTHARTATIRHGDVLTREERCRESAGRRPPERHLEPDDIGTRCTRRAATSRLAPRRDGDPTPADEHSGSRATRRPPEATGIALRDEPEPPHRNRTTGNAANPIRNIMSDRGSRVIPAHRSSATDRPGRHVASTVHWSAESTTTSRPARRHPGARDVPTRRHSDTATRTVRHSINTSVPIPVDVRDVTPAGRARRPPIPDGTRTTSDIHAPREPTRRRSRLSWIIAIIHETLCAPTPFRFVACRLPSPTGPPSTRLPHPPSRTALFGTRPAGVPSGSTLVEEPTHHVDIDPATVPTRSAQLSEVAP